MPSQKIERDPFDGHIIDGCERCGMARAEYEERLTALNDDNDLRTRRICRNCANHKMKETP